MQILPGFNRIDGWRVSVCGSRTIKIKRSWKERIFSRPWRPFISHSEHTTPLIADGETMMDRYNRIIICNENTKKSLIDYAEKMSVRHD